MHGSKSLKGELVPTFRDGSRSKYMPKRLLQRVQEADADPQLLSLRKDVALLEARLSELFTHLDTGETGECWAELRKSWERVLEARRSGSPDQILAALNEHGAVVARGHADTESWHEINGLLSQRVRIIESERRRLIEMRQMLTAEQVMLLVAKLQSIIRAHVTDRDVLIRLSNEFTQLAIATEVK